MTEFFSFIMPVCGFWLFYCVRWKFGEALESSSGEPSDEILTKGDVFFALRTLEDYGIPSFFSSDTLMSVLSTMVSSLTSCLAEPSFLVDMDKLFVTNLS